MVDENGNHGMAELDPDTLRLLEAGDCGTLATDVTTCRQLLAEQFLKAASEINVLLASRDQLKTVNAELVTAMGQLIREHAALCVSIRGTKVPESIWVRKARALLAKAKERGDG